MNDFYLVYSKAQKMAEEISQGLPVVPSDKMRQTMAVKYLELFAAIVKAKAFELLESSEVQNWIDYADGMSAEAGDEWDIIACQLIDILHIVKNNERREFLL